MTQREKDIKSLIDGWTNRIIKISDQYSKAADKLDAARLELVASKASYSKMQWIPNLIEKSFPFLVIFLICIFFRFFGCGRLRIGDFFMYEIPCSTPIDPILHAN